MNRLAISCLIVVFFGSALLGAPMQGSEPDGWAATQEVAAKAAWQFAPLTEAETRVLKSRAGQHPRLYISTRAAWPN